MRRLPRPPASSPGGLRLRALALLLIVAATASCVAADPTETPAATASAAATEDPRFGPVPGLPACDIVPVPTTEVVPDLPFPADTVVTKVTTTGELVQLEGYMPETPVVIRFGYAEVPGWNVIQSEDEGRETEVLIGDGAQRLFVKAAAVCARGSRFVAVLAPDTSTSIPTPTGAATDG